MAVEEYVIREKLAETVIDMIGHSDDLFEVIADDRDDIEEGFCSIIKKMEKTLEGMKELGLKLGLEAGVQAVA